MPKAKNERRLAAILAADGVTPRGLPIAAPAFRERQRPPSLPRAALAVARTANAFTDLRMIRPLSRNRQSERAG